MNAVEFSGKPRAWRIRGFKKNVDFFESLPSVPLPDWGKPNVLVGISMLREVDYCVTCLLVGREELAANLAERASESVASAWAAIGAQQDRDVVFIDRPMTAVASRVGRCLFPSLFEQSIEVPFGAFETFVEAPLGEDPELDSVERTVTCLVWALLACLENRPDQLVQAEEAAGEAPEEMMAEADLLPRLKELMRNRDSSGWRNLEEALVVWRNPAISEQKPMASLHQELVLFALALFWSRFRHERCDREVLMQALLGPEEQGGASGRRPFWSWIRSVTSFREI